MYRLAFLSRVVLHLNVGHNGKLRRLFFGTLSCSKSPTIILNAILASLEVDGSDRLRILAQVPEVTQKQTWRIEVPFPRCSSGWWLTYPRVHLNKLATFGKDLHAHLGWQKIENELEPPSSKDPIFKEVSTHTLKCGTSRTKEDNRKRCLHNSGSLALMVQVETLPQVPHTDEVTYL